VDTIYSTLSLWLDSNADGISTIDEMQELGSAGILRLEIIPKAYKHKDTAGNRIPLWAWATNYSLLENNQYKIVDVFFKPLATQATAPK
jgi:hypothetical protein